MPKYRITGPDGGTYEVNAPEGATEQDVLAYAQQNYKPAEAPKAAPVADDIGKLEAAKAAAYEGTGTDQYGRKTGADFSNVSATVSSTEDGVTDLPAVEVRPDATDGMGWYQKYRAGLGKSMVDTYQGAKQLGVDVIGELAGDRTGLTGSSALSGLITGEKPGSNAVTRWAERKGEELRAEEAERRRLDADLMGTGAGAFGNIAGTVGQLFLPGVAARGTAIGRALLPATVRGNALQGAAMGALQPVAEEGERGRNMAIGGLAGGSGALAGKGLGALAKLAGRASPSALSSTDAKVAEVIRKEASGAQSLMAPAPSAVPGVKRTLAEESRDEGLARLEQTLRGQPGFNWGARETANNTARMNVLEGLAGTDADMAAAETARSAAASVAKNKAMSSGPVSIADTTQRVDAAIDAAKGRPAVQGALQQVKDLLVKDPRMGNAEDDIRVLENVRETIGDMLAGRYGGDSAAALKGSRELIGIRDSLNAEIGLQVPSFTDYLNAYRQGSAPINRMEVGRELLRRSTQNIQTDGAGNRLLAPRPTSNAVRDLDAIAKTATGFNKARADKILSPSDIVSLKSLQDDMERQVFARSAGTGGNSATASRGSALDRLKNGVGNAVAGMIPGGAHVKSFAQFLDQQGAERVNQRLAYMLANPDEARRILEALSKSDRAVVTKALIQLGGKSGAAVPALTE